MYTIKWFAFVFNEISIPTYTCTSNCTYYVCSNVVNFTFSYKHLGTVHSISYAYDENSVFFFNIHLLIYASSIV
jgi:hypothetical protein